MKSLIQYILLEKKEDKKKDEKIVESFIKFVNIETKSELMNLLKEHNSNVKSKSGFWVFDEAIEKDKEQANIGEKETDIKYVEVKYQGKTAGLISYYLDYPETEIKPSLYICNIQSLEDEDDFLKHYFKYLENIAKSTTKRYIVIKPYEKDLIKKYKKHKFKKSSKEKDIMFKEL
jgi:hypothetical protein